MSGLESADRLAAARRYRFRGTPSAEDFADRVRYLVNEAGFDSLAEALDVAWTAVGDCEVIDIANMTLWRRWVGITAFAWGAERGDLTPERLRAIATRVVDSGATMQYRHMDAVFDHSQASGTARLVLLAIAKTANEEDTMYRGAPSLAAMCRMSVRTVERALVELRELGEIVPVGRATPEEVPRADRRPVKYRVNLPSDGPSPCRPVDNDDPSDCRVAESDDPSNCEARPDILSNTPRQDDGQREQMKRIDEHGGVKPRDELFDALAEACGIDPAELTTSARGAMNRAQRDLRAVKATPDEIRARASRHRRKWPKITLTATSLAKHWPELTGGVRRAPAPERVTPAQSIPERTEDAPTPLDAEAVAAQLAAIRKSAGLRSNRAR